MSDDGTHLAYALTPEDGDPTLVVRDLDTGAERRENRGAAPAFAANGRFVVYTHVAAKKDVDAAKKAKKPEEDQPKNGVGILDLSASAPAEIVDGVKTIYVAKRRRRHDRVSRGTVAGAERIAGPRGERVARRGREAERAAQGRARAADPRCCTVARGERVAGTVAVRIARAEGGQDEGDGRRR